MRKFAAEASNPVLRELLLKLAAEYEQLAGREAAQRPIDQRDAPEPPRLLTKGAVIHPLRPRARWGRRRAAIKC